MMEGDSGAYVPPEGGNSVWLVGDRITVKLTSEDTGGAYSVAEEISPPQGGPPPHTHREEDEVLYVLEGEVEFLLGEDTIPAGAGSYVHAPRGALHTFKNVGTSPQEEEVAVFRDRTSGRSPQSFPRPARPLAERSPPGQARPPQRRISQTRPD